MSVELRLRDLSVLAGGRPLLSGVDLQLHPGELCALIGPSGAGKSTLFKALLGLRQPDQGEVLIGGASPAAAGPIGYVPQDDALHGSLRVEQALGYAAELRLPELPEAERERRIGRVLHQVGLSDRRSLRISQLSGGQRKRVSVALELLTAPPLLILDEPTSGLDPGMEATMMGLFADLAHAPPGRVLIVSTHSMASLHRADALAVLVAGRLAWFGPPAEAPAHFGAPHLEGIFTRLSAEKPEAWSQRWLQSPQRAAFLRRPAPQLAASAAALPVPAPLPAPAPPLPAAAPARGPAPPAPPDSAALREKLAALKAARGKPEQG